MKILPQIIVNDESNITNEIKKISNDILTLIDNRVKNSRSARSIESDLHVHLLFDNPNLKGFKRLSDKLYFNAHESLLLTSEASSLATVIKQAILMNVVIPTSITSCAVFISLVDVQPNQTEDSNEDVAPELKYEAVTPIVDLEDVVMNDDERAAIMRAITLISERDLIFGQWGFDKVDKHTKSILCFHGQPGTGKTMAAHAVAKYLGKKILVGSYAEIESEFVGVGAKNLKNFFAQAKAQDAVLFIDEADTFLSKRLPSSNDSSKHYNSMSNELYQLVENFDGCIIFASNHIKDFDPAIISRIIEPVEFKLPDFDARKQIISKLLQNEFPIEGGKSNDLLSELATLSEGFSGRDIRKAILLSYADAAYTYKVCQNKSDDDIIIPVDLVKKSFSDVRKAKISIDNATGKGTAGNLLAEFSEKKKRDARYMQIAAHALLADGRIDPNEKILFDELSKVMKTSAPLNKEELPTVESICAEAKSKEERIQIFDVVSRMAASDFDVPESEMSFIIKVAHLIGVSSENDDDVRAYIHNLAQSYKNLSELTSKFGLTDEDILIKLQREYTIGASYYHLAELYANGSSEFGGILVDTEKAQLYYQKASEYGFSQEISK